MGASGNGRRLGVTDFSDIFRSQARELSGEGGETGAERSAKHVQARGLADTRTEGILRVVGWGSDEGTGHGWVSSRGW